MKQVIVARKDLAMSPGKLAAQVAHASLSAAWDTEVGIVDRWIHTSGQTKVVLSADSAEQLRGLAVKAKQLNVPYYLVIDEGRTELPPSTPTCLGIGPADDKLIDSITGSLKLY